MCIIGYQGFQVYSVGVYDIRTPFDDDQEPHQDDIYNTQYHQEDQAQYRCYEDKESRVISGLVPLAKRRNFSEKSRNIFDETHRKAPIVSGIRKLEAPALRSVHSTLATQGSPPT
jgi:hypothetical protein